MRFSLRQLLKLYSHCIFYNKYKFQSSAAIKNDNTHPMLKLEYFFPVVGKHIYITFSAWSFSPYSH